MSRSDDRGSTSLTTVLLTPVFVVLAFAAFQAAMWTHAVTETRAVARDTAALVARRGARPAVAEASAVAALSRGVDLEHPVVEIIDHARVVVALGHAAVRPDDDVPAREHRRERGSQVRL